MHFLEGSILTQLSFDVLPIRRLEVYLAEVYPTPSAV